MPLLDRLFPRRVSPAVIEQVSQRLPRAAAAPEKKSLSCVCESPDPATVADWLHWSAWQDKQSRQIWVHCTGGVAGVDVWFGPGDPSLAATLGAA
jgi:hypothetical protein